MPLAQLELDCKLNPAQLSVSLADQLTLLEPFGAGNPTPLFGLYNMTISDIHEVGGGKHLKLTLSRQKSSVVAMKFSTTKDEFPFEKAILSTVLSLLIKMFITTSKT